MDAVRALLRHGFAPVPIPFGEKGPRLRDWGNLRIGEADLSRYFNGGPQNVGIILGAPSNHVADVDLDSPEAVAAGSYLLPETGCRWGRLSKPGSHWDYRTPDAAGLRRTAYADPTRKALDDKPIMLVELRANGCQSLVPPSTHPSGEAFEWAANGEPAVVAGAVLQRAVALVAATALLAPRWPAGARHDVALALAGFLGRGGMPEHEIERLLEVVARVAGDPEWRDRVRAARDTMQKLARGERVKGAPSLALLLPNGREVVPALGRWLGLRAVDDGPEPMDGSTDGAFLDDGREVPPDDAPQPLKHFVRRITRTDCAENRIEFAVTHIAPRRMSTYISSAGGLGKTRFAVQMCTEAALGRPILECAEFAPIGRRWLYVAGEDDLTMICAAIRPMLQHYNLEEAPFDVLNAADLPKGRLVLDAITARELAAIINEKRYDGVVIDTLISVLMPDIKIIDPNAVREWQHTTLGHIQRTTNAAIVVLAHDNAQGSAVSGTADFRSFARLVLHLERVDGNLRLAHVKDNIGWPFASVGLLRDPDTLVTRVAELRRFVPQAGSGQTNETATLTRLFTFSILPLPHERRAKKTVEAELYKLARAEHISRNAVRDFVDTAIAYEDEKAHRGWSRIAVGLHNAPQDTPDARTGETDQPAKQEDAA